MGPQTAQWVSNRWQGLREECSEAQAGLAEGATESHEDTNRLMSLEERDQPFKQRREKSVPGREDYLTKTRRLEKGRGIHAQGRSVCRGRWGDWWAVRLERHKKRLRRPFHTMPFEPFKEKIAQELCGRWEEVMYLLCGKPLHTLSTDIRVSPKVCMTYAACVGHTQPSL